MDLSVMYGSKEFMTWHDDHIEGLAHSDPDRYNRLWRAAATGADGSTNAEVIDDWAEFLEFHSDGLDISSAEYHRLMAEIHDCWYWHNKHGSLHEEVG